MGVVSPVCPWHIPTNAAQFFICPVSLVHHRGKDIHAPMGAGQGGDYTLMIRNWLVAIMYGGEDHKWGVVIPEEE